MNRPDKPVAPETISCEVCMKEVPTTEASSAEGAEYVMYFCGLDCYQKWQKSADEADKGAKQGDATSATGKVKG